MNADKNIDDSQLDSKAVEFFRDNRYFVVREALNPQTLNAVAGYVKNLDDFHPGSLADEPQLRAKGTYADPLAESVLQHLQPVLERHTGLSLLPTYSYTRVYRSSAELKKHTDRPSCEISCTLFLGADSSDAWPIFVEVAGEARRVDLQPGDILVYRGIDVPHWREVFNGTRSSHMFLHYVDANGPYTTLAFDGRQKLGAPPATEAPVRHSAERDEKVMPSKPKASVAPPKDGKLSIDTLVSNPGYFFAGYDWKSNNAIFYCVNKEVLEDDCSLAKKQSMFNVPISALLDNKVDKRFKKEMTSYFIWSTECVFSERSAKTIAQLPRISLYNNSIALTSLAMMKRAIDERRTNCSPQMWRSLLKIALVFQARVFDRGDVSLSYEPPTSTYIAADILALSSRAKAVFFHASLETYLCHAFLDSRFLDAVQRRISKEFPNLKSVSAFQAVDFQRLTLPKAVALHWLYLAYTLPEKIRKEGSQYKHLDVAELTREPIGLFSSIGGHFDQTFDQRTIEHIVSEGGWQSPRANTDIDAAQQPMKPLEVASGEEREHYELQVEEATNFAMNIVGAHPLPEIKFGA